MTWEWKSIGIELVPAPPQRRRWKIVRDWLFALAVGGAFWWFFIWAGTRLWKH